jgi:ABC-2 type transport system ATP-binding protein
VSEPALEVEDLGKTYSVPVRAPGVRAALASLFRREKREVVAVDALRFAVEPGEIVGFLGPNGAGKTTTLKMLSGLLYPSRGAARVLGFVPWERKADYLRQMTLVMGQRNQLIWDIPVADSFERNRAIYALDAARYRRTRDELVTLLDLESLLERPVRNLSLGERMKCELAVALVHEPRMLFLDEPTIGVDVTMQRRIREFIAGYNRRTGATVLLTSHYMADVEALCRRVIVIHHGRLLFDGQLAALVQSFSAHKTVTIELAEPCAELSGYGEVVSIDGLRATLRVPKADTAKLTARLLADLPVLDLAVEDPPIEEVIERVFAAPAIPEELRGGV